MRQADLVPPFNIVPRLRQMSILIPPVFPCFARLRCVMCKSRKSLYATAHHRMLFSGQSIPVCIFNINMFRSSLRSGSMLGAGLNERQIQWSAHPALFFAILDITGNTPAARCCAVGASSLSAAQPPLRVEIHVESTKASALHTHFR